MTNQQLRDLRHRFEQEAQERASLAAKRVTIKDSPWGRGHSIVGTGSMVRSSGRPFVQKPQGRSGPVKRRYVTQEEDPGGTSRV